MMLGQSGLIEIDEETFLLESVNFDALDFLVHVVLDKAGHSAQDCVQVVDLEFLGDVFCNLDHFEF